MIRGKYTTRTRFYFVRFYRGLLRLILRALMRWQKLENPQPGYTVAIASHWRFPHMLEASLLFLSKQDLTHMQRVVCAIDTPLTPEWRESEARIKQRFPEFKLEFLYQTPFQAAVLKTIKWGWIDAWLSFSKCIAAAKTRYVILNDNDAMLLDPKFIEKRYQTIVDRGDVFVGICWYWMNGLEESDQILYTVNMAFDAQFVRSHSHPIECFPDVRILNGRTVDMDVLQQCQLRTEKRSILPIQEGQWVHPSQVISQFSYLARGSGYVPPENNNLFFIPYFEYLGGKPNILNEQTELLEQSQGTQVDFLGYAMDMVKMTPVHMMWVRKQIERVEKSLYGHPRAEVERYLRAIESHVPNYLAQTTSAMSS